MKTGFNPRIKEMILNNLSSKYDDNFDELRFGSRPGPTVKQVNTLAKIKENCAIILAKIAFLHPILFMYYTRPLKKYLRALEGVYNELTDEASKLLLCELITLRLLGRRRFKLSVNNKSYWEKYNQFKQSLPAETIDPSSHVKIKIKDQATIENIPYLIFNTFFMEQYRYEKDKTTIEVEPNDIVLDIGAYCAETSIYFSKLAKSNGHVYAFEFNPKNIDGFQKNVYLNPDISNITLVKRPVWHYSDKIIAYNEDGPGTEIKYTAEFGPEKNSIKTISIDDFVMKSNIPRVDYIKMDIEGSEVAALKGAKKTISKCKPKLAISVYHKIEDLLEVPQIIKTIHPDYRLYLGHYTIHLEETVLFAV